MKKEEVELVGDIKDSSTEFEDYSEGENTISTKRQEFINKLSDIYSTLNDKEFVYDDNKICINHVKINRKAKRHNKSLGISKNEVHKKSVNKHLLIMNNPFKYMEC